MDEVEEGEASVEVFFGDGDNEAEVGFDHFGFGLEALMEPSLEVAAVGFEIGHKVALTGFEGGELGFFATDTGLAVRGAGSLGLFNGAGLGLEGVEDGVGAGGEILDSFLFKAEIVVEGGEFFAGVIEGAALAIFLGLRLTAEALTEGIEALEHTGVEGGDIFL